MADSALAGHNERNERLLVSLQKSGVDLDVPRPVDVYFFTAKQSGASQLASSLFEAGYMLLGLRKTEKGEWSVVAGKQVAPRVAASSERSAELIALAEKFGGRYDGWGTRGD